MKRLKEHKAKLITILIILTVAAAAFLVVLFAFRLKTIHVTGNDICSEEEVIENYTSGTFGDNMLMVALKDKLGRFGELPFIRDYEISFSGINEMTIRVYEKCGFESVGIRPGFYDHPKEDAVVMWRYHNA